MAVKKQGVQYDIRADDRASRVFGRLTGAINRAGRAATASLRGMTIAGGAAAGALAVLTARGLDSGDKLAKTADKLNVTTQALTAMRLAAERGGMSSTAFDTALQRFTRSVDEAARGTGTAARAFRALGLDAAALEKMTPDAALAATADALAAVESGTDRVGVAYDLFGARGVGMVNVLRGGSAALEDTAAEVGRLGLALTRVEAAKIEEANDRIGDLKQIVGAVGQQVAAQLAPALAIASRHLVTFIEKSGGVRNVVASGFDSVGTRVAGAGAMFARLGHAGDVAGQVIALAFIEARRSLVQLNQAQITARRGFLDAIGQALPVSNLGPVALLLAPDTGEAERVAGELAMLDRAAGEARLAITDSMEAYAGAAGEYAGRYAAFVEEIRRENARLAETFGGQEAGRSVVPEQMSGELAEIEAQADKAARAILSALNPAAAETSRYERERAALLAYFARQQTDQTTQNQALADLEAQHMGRLAQIRQQSDQGQARAAYEALTARYGGELAALRQRMAAEVAIVNDALAQRVISEAEAQRQVAAIRAEFAKQGATAGLPDPTQPPDLSTPQGLQLAITDGAFAAQMDRLAAQHEAGLVATADFEARRLALEKEYAAARQAVQEGTADSLEQQLAATFGNQVGIVTSAGRQIAAALAGNSKKAFKVSKAFGIAEAVISTAKNIARASEVGFPQNVPLMAAAAAQGAQILASVKSATPGGGSVPNASGGGSVTTREAPAPNASEAASIPAGPPQRIAVSLEGETFGGDQIARLIERLNEASRNGYRLEIAQ